MEKYNNTMKNSELQAMYNNLEDEKVESLLNSNIFPERQPQEIQSQESAQDPNAEETKQSTPTIEGLENFSFENLPEEEIDLKH